ncbi:uncharacterized protein LOC112042865 [Bicyclus anynana]|uniref:Uncharacterized protein LOC112042865 n=1 Tax=Bicyclus anynana TaxID=110368 RepID=A0A6J1MTK8_BICAN|nr:uncharacterized protein LOC112042865 [Bicyclus anynana]
MFSILSTDLEAKPVSLNDIIAAEEKVAQLTARRPTATKSRQLYTLSDIDTPTRVKKNSPLHYRKAFQIESPSKPKKLKISQRPWYNRKKLTNKREINHNDGIIQKYIPLLKNLRLLVDNILAPDSSESYEPSDKKYKRNHSPTNERDKDERNDSLGNKRDKVVCTCSHRSSSESPTRPQEETVTSTAPLATEIQDEVTIITTTTPASSTIDDNVRGIRRYTNVPILSTRNPSSFWRDDSRLGQRDSSSFDRSIEGHIPGNNGANERNTRGETWPHTENYEEYTNSYSRNDASRDRSSEQFPGIGIESGDTEFHRGTSKTEELPVPRNETFENVTKYVLEHEREMEYKTRRDETESSLPVPEFPSRLRGFESQEEEMAIRTYKIDKESILQNSTRDKQFSDGNGPYTSEDQGIRRANKAIAPKHILPNSTYPVGKVVMIFDGYSVAKDVNGNNKLTEKAIQILT